LPKHTLEGRLQRHALLYQRKLTVHDPMDFVKGITLQKLLQGSLSTSQIYSAAELDALVAAYTGWQAATHPDQVTSLGDVSEGLVFLPVPELKRRY
jgi:hypothetical protein